MLLTKYSVIYVATSSFPIIIDPDIPRPPLYDIGEAKNGRKVGKGMN